MGEHYQKIRICLGWITTLKKSPSHQRMVQSSSLLRLRNGGRVEGPCFLKSLPLYISSQARCPVSPGVMCVGVGVGLQKEPNRSVTYFALSH